MNILFGILNASLTAAGVYLVYRFVIPRRLWDAAPKHVIEWREPVARAVAVLTFVVILATNLATYGPRNELSDSTYHPRPERQEADSGERWSNTEDRRGNATELLKDAPVRADITDAGDNSEVPETDN